MNLLKAYLAKAEEIFTQLVDGNIPKDFETTVLSWISFLPGSFNFEYKTTFDLRQKFEFR